MYHLHVYDFDMSYPACAIFISLNYILFWVKYFQTIMSMCVEFFWSSNYVQHVLVFNVMLYMPVYVFFFYLFIKFEDFLTI